MYVCAILLLEVPVLSAFETIDLHLSAHFKQIYGWPPRLSSHQLRDWWKGHHVTSDTEFSALLAAARNTSFSILGSSHAHRHIAPLNGQRCFDAEAWYKYFN